jgi:hypothetical protein
MEAEVQPKSSIKGVKKTPKEKVQPYAMEDTSKEMVAMIPA